MCVGGCSAIGANSVEWGFVDVGKKIEALFWMVVFVMVVLAASTYYDLTRCS